MACTMSAMLERKCCGHAGLQTAQLRVEMNTLTGAHSAAATGTLPHAHQPGPPAGRGSEQRPGTLAGLRGRWPAARAASRAAALTHCTPCVLSGNRNNQEWGLGIMLPCQRPMDSSTVSWARHTTVIETSACCSMNTLHTPHVKQEGIIAAVWCSLSLVCDQPFNSTLIAMRSCTCDSIAGLMPVIVEA
eukprot:1137437-Pelagomonas_calceolata.AAC.3